MKTLVQKAGGSFQLAMRFVGFIREKRRLQERIQALEADLVYYRAYTGRQRAQLASQCEKIDAIEAYRLPADAQELIEGANEILQRLHKGQPMPAWPVRNWRIDYIMWKRQSRDRVCE